MKCPRKWTQEEDDFLKINYGVIPIEEISNKLDRTIAAVKSRCTTMHFPNQSSNRFKPYEIEYINNNYGIMPTKEIAKQLKRTAAGIESYAKRNHMSSSFDQTSSLTIEDANELVNRDVREWAKYGLNIITFKDNQWVNDSDLARIMENHPEIYDATECNEVFFEYYPFFHKKRLQDRQKMIEARWGRVAN